MSNSTYTVPPALVQLEAGGARGRVPVAGESLTTPLSLRLGVADWLEARFDSDGLTREKQGLDESTSFGGLSVGGKARIWTVSGSTLAVEPLVTLPWGRGSDGGTDYGLALLIDRQWTNSVQTDFNFGVTELASGATHVARHELSASTSFDASQRLKPWVELYWFSRLQPGSGRAISLDAGATYILTPRLAVDAGVLNGLATADARPEVFGGLSVILGEIVGHRGVVARLRDAQSRGER